MRPPALLASLAALACALPAPSAAAAAPAPVAAFDLNQTLAASAGTAALVDVGTGNGWGTEAGRRFRSVRQYSGLQVSAPARSTHTLVALLRATTVSGKRRLVDFSSGTSDDGVYAVGGKLAVVRGGVTVAASSAAVIPAGTWRQFVLTRASDGTLTAYVEGEPVLTYADAAGLATGASVRLLRDDWFDATAGAVARVRLYDVPLGPDTVRALQDDKLDGVAPAVAVDAGDGLVGARPTIAGTVADAGSAPERIRAAVDVVDGAGAVVASVAATAAADGRWTVPYPAAAPALTGGAAYTLRVTATDAAGNAAVTSRVVTADTSGPSVALAAPGAIAGARPGVTGTVADPGTDATRIGARVDVLDGDVVVASGPAEVRPDGTLHFAYPADAPDLAEGRTYAFRATATDHLGNAGTTTTQALSDGVAPQGLAVESPAIDVSHPQPFVAGRAGTGARDEGAVTVEVLRGGTPVTTFGAPVTDGRFSARVPVALADGAYTAVAHQCDTAGNCGHASRAFSVAGLPQIPGWEVVARPPAGAPAPAGPSTAATARKLLGEARAALAKRGARRLAKRTTVALTSPVAGSVTLRLYARGLLVTGRRTFRAPGAGSVAVAATKAGEARLRKGAKVEVTVRITVTPKGGKAVTVDGPLTLKR